MSRCLAPTTEIENSGDGARRSLGLEAENSAQRASVAKMANKTEEHREIKMQLSPQIKSWSSFTGAKLALVTISKKTGNRQRGRPEKKQTRRLSHMAAKASLGDSLGVCKETS